MPFAGKMQIFEAFGRNLAGRAGATLDTRGGVNAVNPSVGDVVFQVDK